MPKPRPTTLAWRSHRENFAAGSAKGFLNSSPNVSPIARAKGGEAQPLAAKPSANRNSNVGIMQGYRAPNEARKNYAATPDLKDCTAACSFSNTSKIVTSLVTCNKSSTRWVKVESFRAPPALRAVV